MKIDPEATTPATERNWERQEGGDELTLPSDPQGSDQGGIRPEALHTIVAPRRPGTFDSDAGRNAARKRWAMRAEKTADAVWNAADRPQAQGKNGSVVLLGEREVARAVLLHIANDPDAGENARVSAARALMDAGVDPEGDEGTGLEHLSHAELAALVLGLDA